MSGRLRAAVLALAMCGVVVVLDQASKYVVRDRIGRGDEVEVLPFLDLTNTRNKGVAFGMADGVSPVLIGATMLLLLGLLVYLGGRGRVGVAIWLPAGLLIGGALGNLADRVRDGAVTDFVDLPFWATFNLADVAIVAGVFLLILLPERERDPPES
ncbi:MAG TPA: signal peptidase II [Solirubrobacterales bacterium]|nr:signal peptidase II [Solirubrobacterales bacterium]